MAVVTGTAGHPAPADPAPTDPAPTDPAAAGRRARRAPRPGRGRAARALRGALRADDVAPRTTREWIADALCFAVAATPAVVFASVLLLRGDAPGARWPVRDTVHIALTLAVATAMWWRRTRPVLLAVAVVAVSAYTLLAWVAAALMVRTVAVRRRAGVAFAVAALSVPALAAHPLTTGDGLITLLITVAVQAAVATILVLWGAVVRSRRELVASLRDRARRAEAEQALRMEQAQATERARIAHEIHDVLAHRISQLSLHAGALEVRPDAPAGEVAAAAAVIRASAHRALQDLREVIGVLREPSSVGPDGPPPALSRLPELADEVRRGGVAVDLRVRVDPSPEPPDAAGRTAYRVVQEALANAARHAPGAPVTVEVSGAPGDGLHVVVHNPPVRGARARPGGTGLGLVGLAERVTLTGGVLTHGPDAHGRYTVTARLPWSGDER